MKWLVQHDMVTDGAFLPPPPLPHFGGKCEIRDSALVMRLMKLRFKGVDHPSSNKIPWEFRAQCIKINIIILTRLPNKMTQKWLRCIYLYCRFSSQPILCPALHCMIRSRFARSWLLQQRKLYQMTHRLRRRRRNFSIWQ